MAVSVTEPPEQKVVRPAADRVGAGGAVTIGLGAVTFAVGAKIAGGARFAVGTKIAGGSVKVAGMPLPLVLAAKSGLAAAVARLNRQNSHSPRDNQGNLFIGWI